MLGVGLTIPAVACRARRFDPIARLGSAVYAYFDAERPESLSLSGSNVTSWRDLKNNFVVTQATSGAKPVFASNAINNRPGIVFDGTDDYLGATGTGGIPNGLPFEIWTLCNNQAPATDTTTRRVVSWGTTNNNNSVFVAHFGGTAQRVNISVGTGGLSPANDSSGLHLVRTVVTLTSTTGYFDGASVGSTNVVPSIGNSAFAIGAMSVPSFFAFFKGSISAVIITAPLSTANAAWMTSALKARAGIA
jgi:hypothetical protein